LNLVGLSGGGQWSGFLLRVSTLSHRHKNIISRAAKRRARRQRKIIILFIVLMVAFIMLESPSIPVLIQG
jgi:hypothetical protein